MRRLYQQIFIKQTVREGTEAIDDFFNSDADTNPYKDKRKLNDETRDLLEGNISLHEMTKAVNGFTVNFMRNFGPPWVPWSQIQ